MFPNPLRLGVGGPLAVKSPPPQIEAHGRRYKLEDSGNVGHARRFAYSDDFGNVLPIGEDGGRFPSEVDAVRAAARSGYKLA